ncbi:hypothetical protein PVK06_007265 [Gossypium arboreum]|uniref:Uncharacterized protein n=1 Tax=Gossypium arboreum TaxID=29729 RepID=A0ABR0QH58_GOSAR|nr:hypothetical protein PVK06_007265 [Gossypium arboreum]
MTSEMSPRMDRLSMGDQQIFREDLSSDDDDLAFQFPELKTLKSCDLLSSSWISVAWYPIYRIPTGPTLKDLDACFLTYHYLHTPVGGLNNMDGGLKSQLPVFGLASYKFKSSLSTPNGASDGHLANNVFQAADSWLRRLLDHRPDFTFFFAAGDI